MASSMLLLLFHIIAYPFNRIVRRIKEHMDAIFLGMGGILIPLGFGLIVAYYQFGNGSFGNLGIASVIVGLGCWIYAVWFSSEKEKSNRQKQQELNDEIINKLDDLIEILENKNNGTNNRKP